VKKKTTEMKTINCEEAVAHLNDFIDNYLKGKARQKLLTHISECSHCMERFEFEQMLKTKVHLLSAGGTDTALMAKIQELIASV
jgi:anti-sigma factor (TIGR02949 family)